MSIRRKLVRAVMWCASPQAVAGVQLIIAAVTLIQAIDALRNTDRQIGFKQKR